MIHTITVYCSSRSDIAAHYFDAGRELGAAIAANGWTLVYGGNAIGLMRTLADAVRAAGGTVVGITPQVFVDEGCVDKDCHELIVTETMRQRKELLEQRGDAFIALPGGLGTFEEIIEIIASKALRAHNKPIILLNVAGYWSPLVTMIENGIEQKFIKPRARQLLHLAGDVPDAIGYLRSCHEPSEPQHKLPSAIE